MDPQQNLAIYKTHQKAFISSLYQPNQQKHKVFHQIRASPHFLPSFQPTDQLPTSSRKARSSRPMASCALCCFGPSSSRAVARKALRAMHATRGRSCGAGDSRSICPAFWKLGRRRAGGGSGLEVGGWCWVALVLLFCVQVLF